MIRFWILKVELAVFGMDRELDMKKRKSSECPQDVGQNHGKDASSASRGWEDGGRSMLGTP